MSSSKSSTPAAPQFEVEVLEALEADWTERKGFSEVIPRLDFLLNTAEAGETGKTYRVALPTGTGIDFGSVWNNLRYQLQKNSHPFVDRIKALGKSDSKRWANAVRVSHDKDSDVYRLSITRYS